MPPRGSMTAADIGLSGARTTGEETSVGKGQLPMPGAAAQQLYSGANKLLANAPVFWLIALLLLLGLLKFGFEWKLGGNTGVSFGT